MLHIPVLASSDDDSGSTTVTVIVQHSWQVATVITNKSKCKIVFIFIIGRSDFINIGYCMLNELFLNGGCLFIH